MTVVSFCLLAALAAADLSLDPAPFEQAFAQEEVRFFTTEQRLPDINVLAVTLLKDGTPVILTAKGCARFNGTQWVAEPQEAQGAYSLLAPAGDGGYWLAGKDGCLHMGGDVYTVSGLRGEVTALASGGERVYLGTNEGLWHVRGKRARQVCKTEAPVHAVAAADDAIYLGCEDGLWSVSLKDGDPARHLDAYRDRLSAERVDALASAGGSLWKGSGDTAGKLVLNQWTHFTGENGLPYGHFTCASPGEPGVIWFGTERGAIRFDGTNWFYRAGKRWVPDDRINGIAVATDGTAWIATPQGVSRITRVKRTLAEKAVEYERIIDTRHRRLGKFVLRCHFDEPRALDTASQRASDNDGLYTAMYGAAESFRYGATKDPEAKKRAVDIFRALKLLFEVTGIPGFPARAVIPVEGSKDPNEGFGEAANLSMQKEDPLWKNIVPRWPKSADGQYYWKCDTSSDEICGHFFFYATYFDFVCETDAERADVAKVVHALASHLVDNNFALIDHDGKPTRWGNWSPEHVNAPEGWADRGLQSLEMLSFLNVARHVTGDEKFAKAAALLRDNHAYHANAIRGRSTWPPAAVVPWDGNLAFLSFYGLIALEKDPELQRTYKLALDNNWLFAARQNDPFFNIVYLALHPEAGLDVKPETAPAERQLTLERAVETLARTPQLLIDYRMENSHRLDVYLDPTLRQRATYGWRRSGGAVPIEERSHIRINSDNFDLNWGGEGKTEYESTYYLLPYYMGRYYGLIK
ncbi:MAG: hypothetical protein IT364_10405 [Candidatus Hydrogenedentes bacterium]|nr:hypothetical protein [Candidatus Hydrogenedentota bacterium]